MDYSYLFNILNSINLEKLKQACIDKEFLYLSKALNNSSHLMTWEKINLILRENRLSAPRMRLHQEGLQISETEYTNRRNMRRGTSYLEIHEEKFYSFLKEGATLVIDAIDQLYHPLDLFCGALERYFLETLQTNAYVSFGTSKGFSTHWDDHDVLIFQIYGKKEWFLFGETRKYPMYRDFQSQGAPSNNPVWTGIIEEGDILFIPRGHWHHAIAMDIPSFHLTCGFSCRTGVDILRWLQEKITHLEFFRKDVPRFSHEKELEEYFKTFKKLLIKELNKTNMKNFLSDIRLNSTKRYSYNLPYAIRLTQNLKKEFLGLNVLTLEDLIINDSCVSFKANNKNYRFSYRLAAFFQKLSDYTFYPYDELLKISNLSSPQFDSFLERLFMDGLITFGKCTS